MNRIKLGISIGLTCLMLIGCQEGIRNYIGAVGLTRVHADEITVCRSNSPSTSSFIEKFGESIRRALYASAREVYEQGRAGESSASDRGSDVGTPDPYGEGNVLPAEDVFDDGEYLEVDQEDRGEEVNSLYYDAEPGYNEESVDYGEWVYYGNCRITHYDAGACCCGEWATGCTASGVLATTHHTVATGDDLPFGTELMINGEVYVVEDRGVEPYQVDVFVEDHQTALNMGMYYADVYVRYAG